MDPAAVSGFPIKDRKACILFSGKKNKLRFTTGVQIAIRLFEIEFIRPKYAGKCWMVFFLAQSCHLVKGTSVVSLGGIPFSFELLRQTSRPKILRQKADYFSGSVQIS